MTTTIKSKLVCPYCKARQEYKAEDYFPPGTKDGVLSENQCGHCDQYFNAILQENETKVTTFTNLLLVPGG